MKRAYVERHAQRAHRARQGTQGQIDLLDQRSSVVVVHGDRRVGAYWRLHGCEQQTFWGRQTKAKYQDDYFFVSGALSARIRECEVIDNENVRRLNDHAPAQLEIAL